MHSATASGIAFSLLVGAAGPALAHGPERTVRRELVRIQGYRSSVPDGVDVVRETVFVLFGEEHRFRATEWQIFGFGDAAERSPSAEPERLAVQGERSAVARVAEARPDQRVTILAERRPGSADLFLLAVDLCPDE